MTNATEIMHGIIVVALIAAYVAVTLAGHDGTAVLTALGGYIGGAGVAAVKGGGGPAG